MSDSDPAGRDAPPRRFAVIIGGMKCGTTSLFEVLKQHPELSGIDEKDKDFFASAHAAEAPHAYLDEWSDPGTDRVLLDASVSYAKAPVIPDVPARIASSGLGDWRFIYMVREPVARIESQIRHGLYAGWGRSADKGLTPDLVHFSRYAFQLDEWTKAFPRERIHVVILDEFEADPSGVLRSVCDFLDVDTSFEFRAPEKRYNEGSFFEAPKLVRAAATNPGIRQVVKRLVPRAVITWVRRLLAKLAKPKASTEASSLGRWRLHEEERERIRSLVIDDMTRLDRDYGVPVGQWWHEWEIDPAALDDRRST